MRDVETTQCIHTRTVARDQIEPLVPRPISGLHRRRTTAQRDTTRWQTRSYTIGGIELLDLRVASCGG